MNIYTLLMIIPVVLAVALIIMIVRRNITENPGRSIDIAPAIPAVVVLMIAVLVIAPMAESTQDYIFDEGSGELTINKNIPQLDVQPWDGYADEVTSLVIKDGVTIGSGAFDSLTSLDYVSIGEDVTLGSNVFGVSLKDPFGSSATSPGEYAGSGDGTVYLCDPALFTYNSAGDTITGLTSEGASMVYLVIPSDNGGTHVTTIGNNAFASNAAIKKVLGLPSSRLSTIGYHAFHTCTALEEFIVPEGVTTFGPGVFQNCAALASIDMPARMTAIGANALDACAALTSIEIPAGITTIESATFRGIGITSLAIPAGVTTINFAAFQNCTALTTVTIPGSITALAGNVFTGCTAITSVTFGDMPSTAALTSTWTNWRFYASDATTELDRSVASDLAGKTFIGTYTALVEAAPGQLNLTPQQLQQVNLHTMEDQGQPISLDPLPFQPTVQTQDQEPATA